jgi:outer membrane protein
MRSDQMRYILACSCLWCGLAHASLDPFGTEALLPPKPALRIIGALGDPCSLAFPEGALNLPEVVNQALCNNPQTREMWAAARVQAAQVGVSRASYLPSPSLSASENRSRLNAAPSIFQRNIGLNVSYLLYDFGGRAANLENARLLMNAASAAQDSTVQTIFLQAVQLFYQTQSSRAALDAAVEAERAAKESLAAANARHAAGNATPADQLQAQTSYSQATLNRISAAGNVQIAKGTLANMLGLDANRNVPLADASAISQNDFIRLAADAERMLNTFERDVAALIEEARLKRPDLYAALAAVKAAKANVDAAKAVGKPSISLTASTNQSSDAGVISRGSTAGINLSIPLFSGFASTYQIRAAQAQVEAKNAQYDRLRLQVSLDVWTAYQNLATSTQAQRTSADLLASATQFEHVALGRYKAGIGSMLDALNAQSVLASARQQRIQATFNWNIARAVLAQTMGSLDASLLQTLPDRAP